MMINLFSLLQLILVKYKTRSYHHELLFVQINILLLFHLPLTHFRVLSRVLVKTSEVYCAQEIVQID